MNKKQYNNIIKHTLEFEIKNSNSENLENIRKIFKNMGVSLPSGSLKEILETLKSDDYMGWRSCTAEEAKAAANNGTAAIGLNENKVFLVASDQIVGLKKSLKIAVSEENLSECAGNNTVFFAHTYGKCIGVQSTMGSNYCGGTKYKDVTKHKMVLQSNGYYVCSKCGYKVKSPALEDSYILNNEDYYKVKACYAALPYYMQIEKESKKDERLKTNTLLAMIDDIRSKSSYKKKYKFKDSNGNYKREYTTVNQNDWFDMPTTIKKINITSSNLLYHNGIIRTIVTGLINIFSSVFFANTMYKDLFSALLSSPQETLTDALANFTKNAGYKQLAMIVKLICIGSSLHTEMKAGDILVKITFSVGAGLYVTNILFSCDGSIKAQYHSVE